jgi:TPR repeat protein
VLQDAASALKWYLLAAHAGDKAAQFNLGSMYANGDGTAQDYAESVKWYRLAADATEKPLKLA